MHARRSILAVIAILFDIKVDLLAESIPEHQGAAAAAACYAIRLLLRVALLLGLLVVVTTLSGLESWVLRMELVVIGMSAVGIPGAVGITPFLILLVVVRKGMHSDIALSAGCRGLRQRRSEA